MSVDDDDDGGGDDGTGLVLESGTPVEEAARVRPPVRVAR